MSPRQKYQEIQETSSRTIPKVSPRDNPESNVQETEKLLSHQVKSKIHFQVLTSSTPTDIRKIQIERPKDF